MQPVYCNNSTKVAISISSINYELSEFPQTQKVLRPHNDSVLGSRSEIDSESSEDNALGSPQ
jgi:hypothetical protein